MKRNCTNTDALIEQARRALDQNYRLALYRQIEDNFFGTNGEMPLAPIYERASYIAKHSWLTIRPAYWGGERYYDWYINPLEKYYQTH